MISRLDVPANRLIVDGRDLSKTEEQATTIFHQTELTQYFQNPDIWVQVTDVFENIVLPVGPGWREQGGQRVYESGADVRAGG